MSEEQIIIDDQKKTIHRLQQECTEKTNIIIALGNKLQAKEQECERLKEDLNFGKTINSELAKTLDDVSDKLHQINAELDQLKVELSQEKNQHNILKKMFANIDKANVGLHKKLDQLKTEKETIEKLAKTHLAETLQMQKEIDELKQTLAEIKEIAEEKANVNDWLALEILEKISEVE